MPQNSLRKDHTPLEIQERLAALHYYSGALDGVMGPEVVKAIKAFQNAKHIAVDGTANPETLGILFSTNFNNYSKLLGKRKLVGKPGDIEWYKWKVFVDEPNERLAKIQSVEYRLDKSFPNPIQIVDDRETKFAVESSGWGEFWIYITVYNTDGSEDHTKYSLDFWNEWPSEE